MRQNKGENCVIKSRSLSNDAMVRRTKQDEWVSQPVLYAMKRRNKRDECVISPPHKKAFFFPSFLFATAKVESITAMIFFQIILHPAVLIYDFHIFITSYLVLLALMKQARQMSNMSCS